MDVFDLVELTQLMERTSGIPEIVIGLIDGPVAMSHPDLNVKNIRQVGGTSAGACLKTSSAACMHGTSVAGILCAKRQSAAPAIAPNCGLLVRPIFSETLPGHGGVPCANPEQLAVATIEAVAAGVRVLNLSVALSQLSSRGERALEQALDYAARNGVIVVAAAGNQGLVGSSAITRHRWVLPVIACDRHGKTMRESNLSNSVGNRGLAAPGEDVKTLGADGKPNTLRGTSAATPFVTGAIALLWSEFPDAGARTVLLAVTQNTTPRRTSIVAPLLKAWSAYQYLAA